MQNDHGTLVDYITCEELRPATAAEAAASKKAKATQGVITVDGRLCWVMTAADREAIEHSMKGGEQ